MGRSPTSLFVKQFSVASSARSEKFLSYCVYDRETREAIWIDPRGESVQSYTEYTMEHGLKPSLVLETRSRSLEGASALANFFKVPVAGGKLTDGEQIRVGKTSFSVLKTPGVTDDAFCLHGCGVLFTGETLWLGTASRPDPRASDPQKWWDSLGLLKKRASPEDLVFAGYDTKELAFSLWQAELEKNPDLGAVDFAQFRARKEESSSHKDEREPQSYGQISAEKLSHKSASAQIALVDVRDGEEFKTGHIPGSIHIPLNELAFRLQELRKTSRIYVLCRSGRRSTLAAGTLSYLGFNDVVVLNGGIQAWQNAGLPLEK